ncbi:MAG: hypothetical protein IAI50_05915, partial [Candidatus Eremiobacteraeota bacterium]|nr:hypothetical protein [Candidatus Eremiobacteraeota bacterium]
MLRRPGLAGSIAAAFFVIAATLPAAAELAGGQIATVPHVENVRDLGRAPARTPVSLAFTVIYRNEAELGALIEAQSDPSSPTFHHFLSNDQFNAYFAPTPSAYAQTIATLRRAGFTISTTYSNRTLIDAVAPAAIVERYFGTEIHTVVQAGHGPAYANVRPATIPAELAATVDTIVGFDTLQKARFGTLTTPPFFAGDLPAKIGGPLDGPQGGYGPLAVAQGFDFPVQHGIDGAGHAVANVAGDVSTSDINT